MKKRRYNRKKIFILTTALFLILIAAAVVFTLQINTPTIATGIMKKQIVFTVSNVDFDATTTEDEIVQPGEEIKVTSSIDYSDGTGSVITDTVFEKSPTFSITCESSSVLIDKNTVLVSPDAISGDTIAFNVEMLGFSEQFEFKVKYNPLNYITEDGFVTDCDRLDTIANKTRTLPSDFVPENTRVPDIEFTGSFSGMMTDEAATAIEALVAAAKEEGLVIAGRTAYRSYSYQSSLFYSYVSIYGEAKANTFSARPGQSEHQLGLSIDICSLSNNYALGTSFGDTAEAQWVYENAYKFGYIVRYPLGKEDITGYQYEPWHLRYVGVALATTMHAISPDLTMEEYFLN